MRTIYLSILVLFSFSSFAQNTLLNTPHIEVTGKAELQISPDEIYMDIQLKERYEKGSKISLTSIENKLKNKLEKIGIPQENLFISDINAVLAKTGWWSKEILSTGNYSLKITNTKALKDVFKILEDLKITDARIEKATHSKLEEFKAKNRIAAIKAAKTKAKYLLNAIDSKVGKPLKVNEIEHALNDFAQINHLNVAHQYRSVSKVASKQKSTVQFENIKLTSSIYVVFQIQ